MEFDFLKRNFELAHNNLDYLLAGKLGITNEQQKAVRFAFNRYFLSLTPREKASCDASFNAGLKCAKFIDKIMILCIPADYVKKRGRVNSAQMRKHIEDARILQQGE